MSKATDLTAFDLRMFVLSCLLVALVVSPAWCHESFFGRCPSAPDMANFDMEKFEGLWYIIENFNGDMKCATWNITKGSGFNVWELNESQESGALYALGIKPNLAEINQPEPNHPARLRIQWPLSFAGNSAFTVYNTDYVTVAGIFECQNVGLFHRQNGVVLSRTPTLSAELKQMARVKTDKIKVEYYKPVSQSDCQGRSDGNSQSQGPGPLQAEATSSTPGPQQKEETTIPSVNATVS